MEARRHGYHVTGAGLTRRILVACALIVLGMIALAFWRPSPVQAGCYEIAVTANTPSGIAGCVVWGDGIASHYGPGNGVAMNFCTWTLRHTRGCGWVRITSHQTGITVTAPVVDFCDCWVGSDRFRIVDLQYGVLSRLQLDPSQGLYPVTVQPTTASSPPVEGGRATLPDTALR